MTRLGNGFEDTAKATEKAETVTENAVKGDGMFRSVDFEQRHYYEVENAHQQHKNDNQKKSDVSESDENDESDYIPDMDDPRPAVDSQPAGLFSNRKSFACPRVKPELHTGDDLSNLSPEDIDIVAAMGDSLASGRGLWEGTNVDFRGAAFPIGGDANIDGLVTIPNILLEFNDRVAGVSHGMGSREFLPGYQFNVAVAGSETEDTPEQADELVRRLRKNIGPATLRNKWTLVTIATGTEEFCVHCDTPHHSSLRKALGTLRKGIPKALVVLLGPVHVSSSYSLNFNLLNKCFMPRCPCLEGISKRKYLSLTREWRRVFIEVQNEFNSLNYSTFGVLAIPQLTIHSRVPDSLFDESKPLLNRKGHTYAAKWLWNRLISGPNYNISEIIFSEDSYHCPSVGCPYFRTVQNLVHCSIQSETDYILKHATTLSPNVTIVVRHRERVRRNLLGIIALVTVLALISVSTIGSIFYRRSRTAYRDHLVPRSEGESAPLPDSKLGG